MTPYLLLLDIKSDALFGRGDGLAGLLDLEVQHDRWGCPFLAGRTLKGLLAEECANILYALDGMGKGKCDPWLDAADALFGVPGSTASNRGSLTVGNAQWPAAVRAAVRAAVDSGALQPTAVLDAAGALRRQTAIDPETDSPRQETFRTARTLLRGIHFEADLELAHPPGNQPDSHQAALLAACVKALRRAGTGRNRGRGELRASLLTSEGDPATDPWDLFVENVKGKEVKA